MVPATGCSRNNPRRSRLSSLNFCEVSRRPLSSRRRWRRITPVRQVLRVRVAAVARVAGHDLRSRGEDTRVREVRVDLTHHHDHLARDVLARVDVDLLTLVAAMTVGTIHVKRIAEVTHERIVAVDWSAGRKKLQID